MRRNPIALPLWLSLATLLPTLAVAQQPAAAPGTIVIATSAEVVHPVPTLYGNDLASREVGDQMFLRLAEPDRTLRTSDEKSFEPRLARSWSRRDPLTLVFDLDPRARWHDGHPVTAQDVVFTINRARDPGGDPQYIGLLQHITRVEAEGEHRVVFHFDHDYPEQLYDATFHEPPLPAHLVAGIPVADFAKSDFVAHPVGNGPYRFARRLTEQRAIELAADTTFFLGRPGIGRVIFEAVSDPGARANLIQSGDADAIDNVYSLPNSEELLALPGFHQFPISTLSLGYLLMNTRDPADTTRPHPLFSNLKLRQALTEMLDRDALARIGFGPAAIAPPGPVSQALWVFDRKLGRFPFDTARGRRDLAALGWTDHDGDGILDKDGHPLSFSLMIPATSAPRRRMAELAQEMFRRVGIQLTLLSVEPKQYVARREAGQYDIEFNVTTQDPTPSGLTQSWRCGGLNSARFCDPVFDSLTAQAIASRGSAALWRKALDRIIEDAPAIWVYTPTFVALVQQRFEQVSFRTHSTWLDLWRWRVKRGAELPRDRGEQ